MVQLLWKSVWRFLKKLKIKLPYNPVISHLGCYPSNIDLKKIIQIYFRENENSNLKRDIHIQIFITALFTIAKIWKQPKCPSVSEWIKKIIVYIYVGEMGRRSSKV